MWTFNVNIVQKALIEPINVINIEKLIQTV